MRSFVVVLLLAMGCRERPPLPSAQHSIASSSVSSATPARSATPQPSASFAPQRVDLQGEAMGTKIHFVTHTTRELTQGKLDDAFAAALAEIRRLEALMTTWRDDSELSRINANAGTWHTPSREAFEVFQKSRWASELSEGAFDVTFHALHGVWKFGDAADSKPTLPDPKLVRSKLALVDYRREHLDPAGKVKLAPGTSVDFGGIAKGYAVDKASQVLRQGGVQSFLLQAGGDLYGAGKKPDGSHWSSGIRDPRSPAAGSPGATNSAAGEAEQFFAVIDLENRAFSTAGDYARSFVLDGKRYHHIIDPKTGYPATACRSVTIWAKDAFTADALDDAVFILGPDKGLKLVESQPDVGAVIVDAHNKVWVSKRLDGKVRILRQPTDGS
jgi:thiamine biosynthesis lipoprotein